MIQDYFKFAVKNMRKRKLRAWLTMLGILIAVATIFILISLSLGLQNAVNEQFNQLGADKFFIQAKGQLGAPGTGGAVQLTLDDVEVVKKVAGIKGVTFMTAGNAKIEFNNKARYFIVAGIPLDDVQAYETLVEAAGWKIDDGKLLEKGNNEIVIGSLYKEPLFGKPVSVGNKITINGRDFKVQGILKSVGNPSDDQNILMSYDIFKEFFNSGERVDMIYVQIQPGQNIKVIAERVERDLIKSRDVTEKTIDFTILTPEELLGTFSIILNIITAFLAGIASISLVVGAIGIANTMYTSVLERTKEIGTMKAIGARNNDILLIFLIESGLLGVIGGVIGVALGMGVSKVVEKIAQQALGSNLLQVSFSPYLILGCLAFSFIVGSLAGLLPARQASKLNPVDALRYE